MLPTWLPCRHHVATSWPWLEWHGDSSRRFES
jgi:hypothetical protein